MLQQNDYAVGQITFPKFKTISMEWLQYSKLQYSVQHAMRFNTHNLYLNKFFKTFAIDTNLITFSNDQLYVFELVNCMALLNNQAWNVRISFKDIQHKVCTF